MASGVGAGCGSEPGVEDEARRTALLARLIGGLEQILFDLELVFDEWNVGSAGGSRL